MKTIFTHWFTETDNVTFDPFRMLAFIIILFALVLTAIQAYYDIKSFNLQNFGTGMGILIGSLAILFNLKKETQNEPTTTAN